MLQGLRTVVFTTPDLAAARDWYAALLGQPPYFDEPFYVGFSVGGYELGLRPDGPAPGPGGDTPYWGVEDVPTALERATAAGAEVVEPATEVGGGIVVAAVKDPFGNTLGLIRNPHFALPDAPSHPLGGPVAAVPSGYRLAAGDALADVDIVLERAVALDRATVWDLWTSSAGLGRWLVPTSHIELRVGGAYEWYFLNDRPEGSRGGEGNRVLSFLPGRMLSFTWNAPPELPETRMAKTWVVVELEDADAGTRVRLTHTGWPAAMEGQWPETLAYFRTAWGRVLDALERHSKG